MPILLVDNYDSFTYNLYQMVQALTDDVVSIFRNDALRFEDVLAMRPSRVILSPGPGHPGIAGDFGVCAEIILRQEALGMPPVLGVCLGHQGMVHHLGGTVTRAPEIVHGKTSRVRIEQTSPLLEGLPNPFEAMRYHSLVAAEADLPEALAVTAREEKHGLVMAIQHRERPLYGVQFHPESIGTPQGSTLLANFLERC